VTSWARKVRRQGEWGVVVGALILGLTGCAAVTGGTVALPTLAPPPSGQTALCPAALHTPFTLEGDPASTPAVWGIDAGGLRFDIRWPAGFTARFTPSLEVLDPTGSVVARGGQTVRDAGGSGLDPVSNDFAVCSIGGRTYP
jgi:hypothetical protein